MVHIMNLWINYDHFLLSAYSRGRAFIFVPLKLDMKANSFIGLPSIKLCLVHKVHRDDLVQG